MLTRAIVKDVLQKGNKLLVSIPIITGLDTNKGKKKDVSDSTMEASIMCTPGIDVNYKEGDIVVVGFEDNDLGKPIVLDYLKLPNDSDKIPKDRTYGSFVNLSVSDKLTTSTNVTLGKTSYNQLFDSVNDGSSPTPTPPSPAEPIVLSVNGKIGDVVLNYEDVQAAPDTITYGKSLQYQNTTISLLDQKGETLTAVDIGDTEGDIVKSVNGKIGHVVLNYQDVKALSDTTKYGRSLRYAGTTLSLLDQNGTSLSSVDIANRNAVQSVNNKIGQVVLNSGDVKALSDTTRYCDSLEYVEADNVLKLLDQNGDLLDSIELIDSGTDFTVGRGLELTSDNVLQHKNKVTANTSGIGSATTIPIIKYDDCGHITSITTATVYPPTSAGSANQYWRSDGSGVGTWTTPASSPSNGSNTLISSGAVYTALRSYVPTTRTINGKALSGNITLSASDISGVVPTSRTVNGKSLSSNITLTASDVKALSSDTKYGKILNFTGSVLQLLDQDGTELSSILFSVSDLTVTGVKGNKEEKYRIGNVNLTPADIGAVSDNITINGKKLDENIFLTADDIGALSKDAEVGTSLSYDVEGLHLLNSRGESLSSINNLYGTLNEPPYPVLSVNGQTGNVIIEGGGGGSSIFIPYKASTTVNPDGSESVDFIYPTEFEADETYYYIQTIKQPDGEETWKASRVPAYTDYADVIENIKGGKENQVLSKSSDEDYAFKWIDSNEFNKYSLTVTDIKSESLYNLLSQIKGNHFETITVNCNSQTFNLPTILAISSEDSIIRVTGQSSSKLNNSYYKFYFEWANDGSEESNGSFAGLLQASQSELITDLTITSIKIDYYNNSKIKEI